MSVHVKGAKNTDIKLHGGAYIMESIPWYECINWIDLEFGILMGLTLSELIHNLKYVIANKKKWWRK